MKQKREQYKSNAKVAVVFFAFLIFIVGISLIFKLIILIRNGQFDNSRRFTLSITNGKNIEIMSLSPSLRNIAIFKFNYTLSSSQAGRLLEIPIDGIVDSKFINLNQEPNPLFMNVILNYNKLKTSLTIIDILRLLILAKTVPESAVDVVGVDDQNGLVPDNIVGNSVNDDFVEKDNQTIQIINRTNISGLGSRLAKMITNMGGNVMLVMSEDNSIKKSAITYIDKKTYTVDRLQKILGFEVVREPSNAMSDITIIIGEDKVNSLPF
jgi:hypothetical protein